MPRVLVEKGSGFAKGHATNDFGAIWTYSGTPPQVVTFQAVHPEMYQWLERQYQRAFEVVGVSAMAARAERPAGVTSGRALRTLIDNQSKRFIDAQRAYEELHVDVARLVVMTAKRISEDDPSFEVVYKGDKKVERIRWKDVKLSEPYVLQCFPTSFLPSTPAGKMAALQEMLNAKLIDRETFLRLADFPDLESERDLLTAHRDVIDRTLEAMLASGEYTMPDTLMNLDLAMYIGGLMYLRGRADGLDETSLELLLRWVSDSQALLAKKAGPQAAAAPPPPAPPMNPMVPPPPGIAEGAGPMSAPMAPPPVAA